MSLSATLFGTDSAIFKATNILGLGVPGWLNKQFGAKEQKPTTQRIGELAQQTAKEGEARPILWGRCRPISGNVMHMSEPRIVRREVKQENSGGKGGSKKPPKQYEERVFRSYAIRICEGPITGIIRVWRNNKLVYDARGNEWGEKNNSVFLKKVKFYLGGWTQMPDPTLESIWGAGEVPAYRGTCYMVVADEDLTELSGAAPQYIFEAERAEGTYLTSRPYAIEGIEEFQAESNLDAGVFRNTLISADQMESFEGGAFLEAGEFRNTINEFDIETESFDSGGSFLESGVFRSTTVEISAETEALDSGGAFLDAGVLRLGLISYNPDEFEALDSGGASLIGGTHAVP